MRSGAIVERKVCSRRGREKGPGMKLRAAGWEEGGGWCGCRGPRAYFGGRKRYLSRIRVLVGLVGWWWVVGGVRTCLGAAVCCVFGLGLLGRRGWFLGWFAWGW